MKWFSGLSFKARVFLGCLLVALVPLTFSSVVMTRLFTVSLNRQIASEGARQMEEISLRLTQLLENCEKACDTLTADGSASWVMIDNKTVEIQKDLYLSLYQAVQEIYSHAQFSIYDAGGKLRFTTDTAPKNSALPVYWGLLKKASVGSGITYYRVDPYLSRSNSTTIMQGAYSLENSHGARTGYVVLDFTRENFDNLLNGFYSAGDTLLVLDSHQKPLYCSRPEYGEDQIGDMILHTVSGQEGMEKRGVYTKYLWTREPSHGLYILLQRTAPISAPAVRTMGTVSLALSALGLVLCLMISIVLSRSIAQPVSQLDKAMAKVKKGDLSIRIHTSRQDELGRLTESFNQMTCDLQKYLDDTVQKQKDLNKTTLKLYQTQLNPHFLYNTLDTIKWNARINQIPEIAILAENLAVILRKSISSSPFITLREELETIQSYIQIQKIRFTGRFLCETEIPDQLEDCMVPKMILQPLVENAIIHGLDGRENGYICIYTAQKNGVLSISVTDDGCGMGKEMVDWINSQSPAKRDGHLGLYNVINILRIYYGQEYGMEAAAVPEGTTITLRLPVQKEVLDV
ncbi:sensor histidine kinase [Enterocloster citroniae]|uniref:sensor histidine kinase n=1 Tax=Enterocloster citroniae TaxID=358743 RepID=UPI003064FDE6|nr:sensor histidine kinase [Enterocloster citroniae]